MVGADLAVIDENHTATTPIDALAAPPVPEPAADPTPPVAAVPPVPTVTAAPRQSSPPEPEPASTPAPHHTPGQDNTVEKLPRIRRTIARRMVESLNIAAQLTSVLEVDVTAIAALRTAHKDGFHQRTGIKLSFLPFFAKAAVAASAEHLVLNASLNAEVTEVTYYRHCHLGMAVDSDRGLMVPVIRDAHRMSIEQLARAIADKAERVRAGTISPDELFGGTFTLTNTGSRGALFDTPIINQPQTGILGTDAVVERLVPTRQDGALRIDVRSMRLSVAELRPPHRRRRRRRSFPYCDENTPRTRSHRSGFGVTTRRRFRRGETMTPDERATLDFAPGDPFATTNTSRPSSAVPLGVPVVPEENSTHRGWENGTGVNSGSRPSATTASNRAPATVSSRRPRLSIQTTVRTDGRAAASAVASARRSWVLPP